MAAEAYGDQVTYGRRLGAFLLDGVFSIPIALIFTRPPGLAYSLAVTGVFFVQRVVLTATTGHSIGQRLVGIAVRRLDGKPVGLGAATIRTALVVVSIPVFFVDRAGRGMHDRAAGTVLARTG
ncbi:MAG: RDD family protein [Actinomycetes bacterium]